MIVAEVHRHEPPDNPHGELIMERTYYDTPGQDNTLQSVLKRLELYIVNERLNFNAECICRVRFANLKGATR